MANWSDPRLDNRVGVDNTSYHGSVGVPDATYDAGLRSYMQGVYNYMAAGVGLTGVVAYLIGNSSLVNLLVGPTGFTLLGWVALFAPLAFVLVLSAGVNRMSEGALKLTFWAFAAVMGASLSTIFLRFTDGSIAQTFFATAVAFLGLSIWGYTTKKNLSGWGSFLIMGVVGLIVASIINIFLQSSALHFAVSAIGVLVFAGLTAYDTQRIKSMYFHVAGSDMVGKTMIMGALSLYLDFINMFQFLLSFMGSND